MATVLALACCAMPAAAARPVAKAAAKPAADPLKPMAEQRAAIMESLARGDHP